VVNQICGAPLTPACPGRRCEGSGLVGGTEVVGDGHVIRIVDGRIDSLADHAQLQPCGVEGVVNFTPGRVVGHLVTDENANAHERLTSYRPLRRESLFSVASGSGLGEGILPRASGRRKERLKGRIGFTGRLVLRNE
jgi:hypothetical protein